MRIAYVYDSVYPFVKGGGERRIYEVASRLSHRGHEISILGMKCWDGPRSFRDNGLYYRAISRRINPFHRSGRRSISQALGFGASAWQMLGHGHYDVVDCGQWPYFHLLAAKAYSIFRRTTFIVAWYEVWKDHWLEYLGKLGVCGMVAERAFCRLPDRIVAVSEMTRRELVDLGTDRERVTVIPLGIDVGRIQSVPAGPVATDLAYCGRLKNHKNVHLLIEAIALLKRSHRGISAVIIGDGPESAALRRLAAQLGVDENIIFTGALDDFDEVIGWLKASKIFLNPSTKEGGGSITLFEANACGLPVVAVRCPHGIDPLLIREGENGYFVEPSPERIAGMAMLLLNNPCRLSANSAVSKEMAGNYDWDIIASQYEQLYEREMPTRRSAIP
jgi:glycosyltransferase involved in cell wall biosynthesis